jgi:hypothetical protein
MNVQVFIAGSVIDELIEATGFGQVAKPAYGIEYKCHWLLERIGILREEATHGNILHDNPEVKQLVALVEFERGISNALRQTLAAEYLEVESLRDRLKS